MDVGLFSFPLSFSFFPFPFYLERGVGSVGCERVCKTKSG